MFGPSRFSQRETPGAPQLSGYSHLCRCWAESWGRSQWWPRNSKSIPKLTGNWDIMVRATLTLSNLKERAQGRPKLWEIVDLPHHPIGVSPKQVSPHLANCDEMAEVQVSLLKTGSQTPLVTKASTIRCRTSRPASGDSRWRSASADSLGKSWAMTRTSRKCEDQTCWLTHDMGLALIWRFPARHGGTPLSLDGLFHGKCYKNS